MLTRRYDRTGSTATGEAARSLAATRSDMGTSAQVATATRMASTTWRSSRASSECLRKAIPSPWPSPVAYDVPDGRYEDIDSNLLRTVPGLLRRRPKGARKRPSAGTESRR